MVKRLLFSFLFIFSCYLIYGQQKKPKSKHLLGVNASYLLPKNVNSGIEVGIYYQNHFKKSRGRLELNFNYLLTEADYSNLSKYEQRKEIYTQLTSAILIDWYLLKRESPINFFLGGGFGSSIRGVFTEHTADYTGTQKEKDEAYTGVALLANGGLEYNLKDKLLIKLEAKRTIVSIQYPENTFTFGIGYKF